MELNIYPINTKTNHFLENYIFDRKKLFFFLKKGWYFLDFRHDPDPDPYKNETDPKH